MRRLTLAAAVVAVLMSTPLLAGDSDGLLTPGDPSDDGVLTNDFDIEGDSLSVSLTIAPEFGTLTLNSDGTFAYTHNGPARHIGYSHSAT